MSSANSGAASLQYFPPEVGVERLPDDRLAAQQLLCNFRLPGLQRVERCRGLPRKGR